VNVDGVLVTWVSYDRPVRGCRASSLTLTLASVALGVAAALVPATASAGAEALATLVSSLSGVAPASAKAQDAKARSGFSLVPFLEPFRERTVATARPSDLAGEDLSPAAVPGEEREGAKGGSDLAAHPFTAFGHTLVTDTVSIASAPLGWDSHDWLLALSGVAGVAALTAFDENIAHSVQAHRTTTSDKVAHYVEPFGADRAFVTIGAFYLAGLVFQDDRAKDVAADSVVSSIIAGGLISPILKKLVGRSRPSQTGGEEDVVHPLGSSQSFPSGHTTEAFAVASVIASHYSSTWVKVASYGLATMVGLARIDHNAHFASDVLAGALIGTTVGRAVVRLDDGRRGEHTARTMTVTPLVTAGGAGIGLHIGF
jgi:membrane-associated phospholipid phosphatase